MSCRLFKKVHSDNISEFYENFILGITATRGYELEPFSSYVKPIARGNPDLFKQNVCEIQNPACTAQCPFITQGRELVDSEEMNHVGEL